MKKNIDKVFKDQFNHAEITPPEEIWENISAQLPLKKRKKKIIPIWYLMAGTAAAFAIIVLIFKDYSSPNSTPKITNSPENSVDNNNNENPDVSKFQKSEPEPLVELKNEIVQSNIQETESPDTIESHTNNIIDKNSQISLANKSNTSYHSTENELMKMELESRKNENLNTDLTLSQLILSTVEITANDYIILKTGNIAAEEKIIKLLMKKELIELEKTPIPKRLSVTTAVGALHFDNLNGGSGVDNQFKNNNSSSEITTSYGIYFGYRISQKIKIRTGISKINLINNTQDVTYSSILNSQVIDWNTPDNPTPIPESPVDNNESPILDPPVEHTLEDRTIGELHQNIGFIEVPSEIEYLILGEKFEINLIGGFSILFLNKNKISLKTENYNTNLGEAKNLNEISFTANAGLGLGYKISPQFQFNIEPILKYQLNTFGDTKNFNPYYFGIYSGFSFKF